jgi:transposase-like protein
VSGDEICAWDLAELVRELGVAPSTILRWVIRYVPELEKCWQAHEPPVGDSWRVDETYLNVRGRWVYLYRAVDKQGKTLESWKVDPRGEEKLCDPIRA